MAQKFRTTLEKQKCESEHAKINKKVSFLHHILLIANWVNNFDINSVNDCFDNSQNVLPPQLR